MISHFYLIRHGETAWSKSGQHTGRSEIPLTEAGEAEARTLPSRLAGVTFTHVFTSPRLRARRTCELAGLSSVAQVEEDLAEWDYGRYEGRTIDQVKAIDPGWDIYRDGCPDGESPSAVSMRADRLITKLRSLDGTVALFSHGHFGRVLSVRWIGLPVPYAGRFAIGTASIGVLSFDRAKPDSGRIVSWNLCNSD